MPSCSAAYVGIAITAPVPFSCAPVMIVPVPSEFSFTYAPLLAAKHGHQPTEIPIASSSGSSCPYPISSTAFSSVSFIAIRSRTWPVAVTEPFSISVWRRRSTGSIPSASASSSMCCSSAQHTCGAVGARIEDDGWLFE